MAENILGLNYTFPIYNPDGTSFHDLVLNKSTYESVVMSLGDKITGDVYYIDNTLHVTMQEYIILDGVKYTLVSPPTVVREGMVSDNGQLKGMTKYSFTFYHPMYMLGNFPFTDIAVTNDEKKYLSQNKTFSWIGTLTEFVAKLNANLANTEWLVDISDSVSQEKKDTLSEVLSFDKNFISDALKQCFDTWKVPFVITQIVDGETGYSNGKRFLITFGLPTQEIYSVNSNGNITTTPYIFEFGKGVGLKNNSRTPKNNKIVTRLSGCGSERNVPFGYPQIIWTGNQSWSYTINNSASRANSYPIYDGIVGGQKVRLIKHPFTRSTLMPSIYVETVNKKVNPRATSYDPNIEIKDYYDAIDDATHSYPNNINPLEPSFEIHQFEDIYPRLSDVGIVGVSPYDGNYEMLSKSAFNLRVQALKNNSYNYNEKEALQAIYENISANSANVGGSYTYQYRVLQISEYKYGTWYHVKYTSSNVNFEYIVWDGTQAPQIGVIWNDEMDDNGEYVQSYFKMTLPQLSFDLYASAAVTQEMQINMRSGSCMGCTFNVQVDWEDYKKNFYDSEGKFDPVIGTGHPRDGQKYPNSQTTQIEVIVQKDNNTFGMLLPNTYRQPIQGDKFVILGISLPTSYITQAEEELDDAMKEYMLENNVHYYDYPLKFDEYFLANNTGILSQFKNNNIVRFIYAGSQMALYIKQITIKYGEKVLPQYEITLTDDVEIVLNKIGQVTDDVSRMRVQMSELQKYYSENIINEIREKLSRIEDDVCAGRITFQQGLDSIGSVILHDEIRSPQYETGLYTGKGWRIDHLGNAEFESARIRSYLEVVELLINRLQAQEGDTLFTDNDQIDKVEKVVDGNNISYILSLKEKYDGYLTSQMEGNIVKGIINTLAAKQAGVSEYEDEDTEEIDGENTYYTSWMRVVETSTMPNSTLGKNQIRVVLYGDNETPARKNFEPCELMTIARWGCVDYSTDEDDESVLESIQRRQRMFMISTSEGRVVKYTGVDSPILHSYNYGVTIGELPDFVKNYPNVQEVLEQVGEHSDWLYAQGIVVGNYIKIDREGRPEIAHIDCGEWVDGGFVQNPSPRNGIYLCNEWNDVTQQFEIHDVWHNGARWRCLQHQPVVINGVTTYQEPSEENSDYWIKLEGGNYDVYRLKPSLSIITFNVDANNDYTPSSVNISCGCIKTTSTGVISIPNANSSIIDNKYDIYFRMLNANGAYTTDSNHPNGWYLLRKNGVIRTVYPTDGGIEFALGNVDTWPTPLDTKMIDIQRIPVIKNGTNGSDGSNFAIKTNVDYVTIPSNESTTTLSTIATFVRRTGSGAEQNYMAYYSIYKRIGETYTLLSNGYDDGVRITQDVDSSFNAIVVFLFSSAYTSSAPTSQTYLAKKEIVVNKDGDSVNPNILLNTTFEKGIDFVKEEWQGNWDWIHIDDSDETITDGHVCVAIGGTSTTSALDFRQNVIGRLKNNTWYTISFNYYSPNSTFNTYVYTNEDSGNYSVIDRSSGIYVDGVFVSNPNYACYIQWAAQTNGARHSFTFKTASTFSTQYALIMFRCLAHQTLSICMPKLEQGMVATAYIPNDNDLIGEDGKGAAIAFATPSSITVQCNANTTGSVISSTTKSIQFTLKVGNNSATVTGVTYNTLPTGVTATSSYTGYCDLTISTSANANGIANGVTFIVTGTYDNVTYSAPVTIALIGARRGMEGDTGKMGRSYYFANDWNASDTNNAYTANDAQAPFFRYNDSYWVFVNEDNFTNKSMYWIDSTYGSPSSSNPNWQIMTNDFKYLITEAIFGNYAHFGANIINGDYRFSQYGYMRGFNGLSLPINTATQYQNIDTNDPFGESDILVDSRKVVNKVLDNVNTVNQGYYAIVGSMIEFAPSNNPSSSQIHSVYQSSDVYFRYRSNTSYQSSFSSWYSISSYTFAASSNSGATSSNPSSISSSWSSTPPTLTQEKPYLWLKTSSSACRRVSSILPNFALAGGKYYTMEICFEYDMVDDYSIRIGTQTSYTVFNINAKNSTLVQHGSSSYRLSIFGMFRAPQTWNAESYVNNVWINADAHVEEILIYEAPFVPYLCEDLKSGKLVANNIVARGDLHADSFWFDVKTPPQVPNEWIPTGSYNDVYVESNSIVTIPNGSSRIRIILPTPESASHRVYEIYNASEYVLNWVDCNYNDTFVNILNGATYKEVNSNFSESYLKLWSDGSVWYVLKAEHAVWDNGHCYIHLSNMPNS